MIPTYINATDARRDFFDLLEGLKKSPFPVTITYKGMPRAVLMSQEDYNGWVATMETLADEELMQQTRESNEAFAKGDTISWEELKGELELGNNKSDVSDHSRSGRKKKFQKN